MPFANSTFFLVKVSGSFGGVLCYSIGLVQAYCYQRGCTFCTVRGLPAATLGVSSMTRKVEQFFRTNTNFVTNRKMQSRKINREHSSNCHLNQTHALFFI